MAHWTTFRAGDSGQAVAGTSATFPRCGKRLQRRGPRLVGKSDEYRRYARECLEMASAISDPRARASLLQMAQVWFRLADRMPADAKDNPSGRRLKSRWLGRELGPRQRHLVQDRGGARSRPVRPGAGIPPQICDIVWTGPFVTTTRRQLMRSGCMRVMPPGTFSTGAGCVGPKLGSPKPTPPELR